MGMKVYSEDEVNLESKYQVTVVDADLHIQEPHDIIIGYFKESNHGPLTAGKFKDFRIRILAVLCVLVFLKLVSLMSGLELFFSVLVSVLPIWLLFEGISLFVKFFNTTLIKHQIKGMLLFFVLSSMFVVLFCSLLMW